MIYHFLSKIERFCSNEKKVWSDKSGKVGVLTTQGRLGVQILRPGLRRTSMSSIQTGVTDLQNLNAPSAINFYCCSVWSRVFNSRLCNRSVIWLSALSVMKNTDRVGSGRRFYSSLSVRDLTTLVTHHARGTRVTWFMHRLGRQVTRANISLSDPARRLCIG